jgi:hypothetical protein
VKSLFLIFFCLLSLPGFGQEADDDLINEVHSDRKKQTELATKLDEASGKIKETFYNAPEELKKLGHETVTAASLMDEKVVRVLQKMTEQNPLKYQHPDQVRMLILEKSKGKPFEQILRDHPKVLDTTVDFVRDEKALPSLVGLLLKRDALKIYFYIWVGLIILSWGIKKFWIRKKKRWSKLKRFSLSLMVSLSTTAVSFYIFYNMFTEELTPSIRIISSHWHF